MKQKAKETLQQRQLRVPRQQPACSCGKINHNFKVLVEFIDHVVQVRVWPVLFVWECVMLLLAPRKGVCTYSLWWTLLTNQNEHSLAPCRGVLSVKKQKPLLVSFVPTRTCSTTTCVYSHLRQDISSHLFFNAWKYVRASESSRSNPLTIGASHCQCPEANKILFRDFQYPLSGVLQVHFHLLRCSLYRPFTKNTFPIYCPSIRLSLSLFLSLSLSSFSLSLTLALTHTHTHTPTRVRALIHHRALIL